MEQASRRQNTSYGVFLRAGCKGGTECCCLQDSQVLAVVLYFQVLSCTDPWGPCHHWALLSFLPCCLQDKAILSMV